MAKSSGQKLKLLYLLQILSEKTDDEHAVTMQEIIAELAKYGVSAERKSVYDDIAALREYGVDVEIQRGKRSAYYIANRRFQLPELKLLVDAIQCSKFITYKKSNELIKKVEAFASVYEARQLQRQVYVTNRIKAENESIYYNIDMLHDAISSNRKISFAYEEWALDFRGGKKLVRRLRKDGGRYLVSPWALTWNDENYYLLAYDEQVDSIKHFRVDKIVNLETEEAPRQGQGKFDCLDMAVYEKKFFGMFTGKEETVRMVCENHLVGVIVDRFGPEVFLSPMDEEHFCVVVRVVVSPRFLGWLMGFSGQIQVTDPLWVRHKVSEQAQSVLKKHESS